MIAEVDPASSNIARVACPWCRYEILVPFSCKARGLCPSCDGRFEKFVRASSAPGVGLGLAVVRAVVDAHGGTAIGENRLGGGACFRITLPISSLPAAMLLPKTLPA